MFKVLLFLLLLMPIQVNAASAYIVMDMDSNRVLEGNNIHAPYLIASITKIMTAIVVINHAELDKKVTIVEEVLKSYGSGIYVEVGEKITIEDLLYGLMLRSGNDAAIALAHEVGGSMEGFVYLMNETARNIGMRNTIFINNHGLEEQGIGNMSTAYDMALLSSYAMQNDIYKTIASEKKRSVKTPSKTYIWHNKNRLLSMYKYATGGKTGFTEKAGRTLVTTASKDNMNITVVTLRSGNDFNTHLELYERIFKSYQNYQIIANIKDITNEKNAYIIKTFNMTLTKSERDAIKINTRFIKPTKANVIGEAKVNLHGKEYFRTNIYLREEPKRFNFWSWLKGIFR